MTSRKFNFKTKQMFSSFVILWNNENYILVFIIYLSVLIIIKYDNINIEKH